MIWQDLAVLGASYLLGSIPWAYLVALRLTGRDLRYVGNGNVGARNTFRVAGRAAGLTVIALDIAKGAAAYWVAWRWSSSSLVLHLAGGATMLGHWFPLWLRGRGGIGQAAITGFIFARWPLLVPITVPVFLLGRRVIPQFNLAYALAAVVGLAVILWRGGTAWDVAYPVILLGIAIGKKIVDGPRQRAMLAATWPDEAQNGDSH